jgi:putative methyltransferase
MNNDVLDIIKRKNLNQHQLSEIFQLCNENHIPAYTEMILGLPGETLNSWKNGVFQLFEHGNHNGIDFIQAQMLVNAEMSYGQKDFYKMQTVEVYDYMSSLDELGDCPESIEIVVSTRSMPNEDMLEAQVWTSFIIALHINSITSWIARFLVKYQNISYSDFYEQLYKFIQKDSWVCQTLVDIKHYFHKWTQDGFFDHPIIGGVPVTGINIGYRFLIDIHLYNKIDHILSLTKQFVTLNYDLSTDLVDELFRFQKDGILTYDSMKALPSATEYRYDFLNYINYDSELDCKSKICIALTDVDTDVSQQRFLENLYYGRKRFYTKLKITQGTQTQP